MSEIVETGRASERPRLISLIVAVCVTVIAAHWPVLSAGALAFDDDEYLVENALVQNPGWASASRFFSEVLEPSTVDGYYQPLSMISLMLDFSAGGSAENLAPFHRTSLVLHALNTALVIWLLYLLFGQVWIAAGVGLLFGVHPITVESIAWIAQRKTLLAAFFVLASLILYIRYTRSRNGWAYAGCLAAYLLALLSKPSSVPLPALLLLLDYWPIRRLNRRAVIEKVPFFLVGAGLAIVTLISQSRTASVTLPGENSLARMALILCHNIVFYLYKFVWPANLSAHYAFPQPMDLSNPILLYGVIGTCILIPVLVLSLRWSRAPLTGWLFFFLAISPTLGFIGFTNVIAADRFAYLPSVGLLTVLAAFLVWLFRSDRARASKWPIGIAAAVLLGIAGAEAVATQRYLAHWRDTVSLYEHMLKVTPTAPPVHNNLGNALRERGEFARARQHYDLALRFEPGYVDAYHNLGSMFEEQGMIDRAILNYRKALELAPNYAEVHNKLGIVLQRHGDTDEAIRHYRRALDIQPQFIQALNNLAIALKEKGELDEAIGCYRRVLEIAPNYFETRVNLAIALLAAERPNDAILELQEAVRIKPDFAVGHNHLALLLRRAGRSKESLHHFQEALRPQPNWPQPLSGMAWILATHPDEAVRDAPRALELARRAATAAHQQDVEILDTLAAAYAANGQFERAGDIAERAVRLMEESGEESQANAIRERLALYRRGEAYRDASLANETGD